MLVLPGSATPHEAELRALASQLGVAGRVRFPAWLPAADLEGLYRLAAAFVLPSFEEGFGLPILEAMGRGVPVACSNTSSLPEVAGDAAELFDPRSPEDIARAIARRAGRSRAPRRAGRPRPRALSRVHLGADRARDARDLPAGGRGTPMTGLRAVAFNALFFDPGVSGGTETYLRGLVPAIAAERPDLRLHVLTTGRGARALRDAGWQELARHHRPARRGGQATAAAGRGTGRRAATLARRGRAALARQHRTAASARAARAHDPRRQLLHHPRAAVGEQPRLPRDGASRRAARRPPDRDLACRRATRSHACSASTCGSLRRRPARRAARRPTRARGRGARRATGSRARASCCASRAKRPHKNQEALLRALPHLPADVVVVLAGHPEAYDARLRRARGRARASQRPRAVRRLRRRRRARGALAARGVRRVPDARGGLRAAGRSRRCSAACRWPARTSRCCARSAATCRPTSIPTTRRDRRRACVARSMPAATAAAAARAARLHVGGGRPGARSRPTSGRWREHVGLNLVFLVPGETGGMEIAARELIPALRGAAPGARLHRVRQPRGGRRGPRRRRRGACRSTREPRRVGARRAAAAAAGWRARAGCDLVHSLASHRAAARPLRARHHDPRPQLPARPGRALRRCAALGHARARAARGARARTA